MLFENQEKNRTGRCMCVMMTSWWDKWHFCGSWRAPGTVNNEWDEMDEGV